MGLLKLLGFCVCVFLVCALSSGFGWAQAQDPPEEAISAAQAGLSDYLQAIPPTDLSYFNFQSLEQVEQATLGDPFMIYTIDPYDILAFKGDTPVRYLLQETGIWMFPVMAEGKMRTFLKVEKRDQKWQAISLGASGLCEEWDNIAAAYPADKNYTLKMVRIYQATSDLVLLDLPQGGNAFLPLRSARIALGVEGGKLQDPAQVLFDLQQPVRQNLEQFSN